MTDFIVRERVFVFPTLTIFEQRPGDRLAGPSDIAGLPNL